MGLTFATWNLRAGGGTRVPRIVERLRAAGPDVAVLTEFRRGRTGDELLERLAAAGLVHVALPPVPARTNSVLVASRHAMRPSVDVPLELSRHIAAVEVAGVAVFGVYFPQKQAKRPVFEWLLGLPDEVLRRPAVILGDLNTGRNDLDVEPGGARFHVAEAMNRLASAGWTDAWRHFHRTAREYSWRSRKSGFRIDHAFVSRPLVPRLRGARYDHTAREAGISDHSLMVVEVGRSAPSSAGPDASPTSGGR